MQRSATLDAVRGILMLYIVVVIHGAVWLQLASDQGISPWLFEMPPMFMVSGAAFWLQTRGQPGPYAAHLLKRGWRILLPYLAYGLACAITVEVMAEASAPGWPTTLWNWLNPMLHGRAAAWSVLGAHLWFIPVFLLVTAALPWATRWRAPAAIPPWGWLLAWVALQAAVDLIPQSQLLTLRQTVHFMGYTLLGWHLARAPEAISTRQWLGIGLAGVSGLLLMRWWQADPGVLNMQQHKFPPSTPYLLFGLSWVSLFMALGAHLPQREALAARLVRQAWLRPFVRDGYSIYLWQGLSFSLAMAAAQRWQWPAWSALVSATLGAILFGRLTSPIERLGLQRLRWPSAPHAPRAPAASAKTSRA